MSLIPDILMDRWLANRGALLAADRFNLDGTPKDPDPPGVTSGPGNQGTAAFILQGEAGTAGGIGAVPLTLPAGLYATSGDFTP